MNGAATTFEEDGSIHNIIGEPAQGGESSSSAMLLGETTSENVAADASTVHDVHDAVVSTNTNHAGTVQATIYLLLLIHAVFLYQYYAKKKTSASYKAIVGERRFYLLFIGMISHITTPTFDYNQDNASGGLPTTANNNDANNNEEQPSTANANANANSWRNSRLHTILQRPLLHLRRRFNIITPSNYYPNTLSQVESIPEGLWLMAFCTHLIWQFRALEELFGGAWLYARTILVLGSSACALELLVLHSMHHYSINFNSDQRRRRNYSYQQYNATRAMTQAYLTAPRCGLTSITCALLILFSSNFPLVRIPILPTLGLFPLNLLFRHRIGDVGFILILLLMHRVSRKTHPLGSMAGLMSGSLHQFGVTKWLVQSGYWFAWFVGIAMMLCAVSLKAHGVVDILCIDYVSWDGLQQQQQQDQNNNARANRPSSSSRQGRARRREEHAMHTTVDDEDRNGANDSDNDDENDEYIDLETGRTIVPGDAGITQESRGEETEPLIERNRDD